MPRGKLNKQSVEAEVLPSEDSQSSQKVIKHKTEWVEVVEEAPEEIGDDFDEGEADGRPRRKTKNAREELRKKLRAQGVSPSTNLRLYIEKYLHSDSNAGGSYAETEFCTKYETTEDHILNKDYIDVARRWGAGKYRITVRMQNRIVDAFDQRISAMPVGNNHVIQNVNPADPNSPQVIVNMPEGSQQSMPIADPFKEAEKALNLVEKYNRAFGRFQPQSGESPARSEEEILAGAMLKQPAVIENVIGSIISRFGVKGPESDEPGWSTVVMKAIENNQIADSIQALGNVALMFLDRILPSRGQNNGQTQVAQAPLQNQQTGQGAQVPLLQTQQQGDAGNSQSAPTGSGPTELPEGFQTQAKTITPEQHALSRLIQNCQSNVPVKIAFDQLIKYADAINEEAPAYSIDGYIDLFGSASTDQVLDFVKTIPGGEQIAALPHTRAWTEQLQILIKESQEGEEE